MDVTTDNQLGTSPAAGGRRGLASTCGTPLARFMIRWGLAPRSADGGGLRVLEVAGRKTGRPFQRPVTVVTVQPVPPYRRRDIGGPAPGPGGRRDATPKQRVKAE